MICKQVNVPTTATSVYNLMKSYLSAAEVAAIDDYNQQLKFNVLLQVTSSNSQTVCVGGATDQEYYLVKPASTATNQYEFNKQSITEIFIRGTGGDKVTIVLLPCSN